MLIRTRIYIHIYITSIEVSALVSQTHQIGALCKMVSPCEVATKLVPHVSCGYPHSTTKLVPQMSATKLIFRVCLQRQSNEF